MITLHFVRPAEITSKSVHSKSEFLIKLQSTICRGQNPLWEADKIICWDFQEIPLISWSASIHYCVHKRRPTLVRILDQINLFNVLLFQFLNIPFSFVLKFASVSKLATVNKGIFYVLFCGLVIGVYIW